MITIAKRVEQLIERWPMLRQGLEMDLLNVSSVARYLKPEVESEIGERISEAAILMAIRRYQKKDAAKKSDTKRPQDFLGDMSVRPSLCDLTFANSPTLQQKVDKIASQFSTHEYFTVSRGILQTSVILYDQKVDDVLKILNGEHLEQRVDKLSAITLWIKRGYGSLPGILVYPLNALAWRGIAVIEIISTYDELNIILYDKDVELAFRTLKQALN